MALNSDIFLLLLDRSTTPGTISNLMHANKFLYHEGAKRLLARPIKLRTQPALASFLRFMAAEAGARLPHLRSLALDMAGDLPPELASGLLRFLRPIHEDTLCLYTLHIADAERLLASHPRLPAAFAAITSLEHVRLANAGPFASRMLANLQSELSSSEIRFAAQGSAPAAPALARSSGDREAERARDGP